MDAFKAEIAIHSPGWKSIDRHAVFVYPELVIVWLAEMLNSPSQTMNCACLQTMRLPIERIVGENYCQWHIGRMLTSYRFKLIGRCALRRISARLLTQKRLSNFSEQIVLFLRVAKGC
jgi:hypothetical protein